MSLSNTKKTVPTTDTVSSTNQFLSSSSQSLDGSVKSIEIHNTHSTTSHDDNHHHISTEPISSRYQRPDSNRKHDPTVCAQSLSYDLHFTSICSFNVLYHLIFDHESSLCFVDAQNSPNFKKPSTQNMCTFNREEMLSSKETFHRTTLPHDTTSFPLEQSKETIQSNTRKVNSFTVSSNERPLHQIVCIHSLCLSLSLKAKRE